MIESPQEVIEMQKEIHSCKNCASKKCVKAGFVEKEQRYKCKECGCQFVPTRQQGRSENTKMTAVWLYMHGLSLRTIGRFVQASASGVLKWVREFARENYIRPQPLSNEVVVELDEMWHYLKSKKTKSGYGRLIVAIPVNLSTGNVEGEMLIHLQECTSG